MTVFQRQYVTISIFNSKISSAEFKEEKFWQDKEAFKCVRNKTTILNHKQQIPANTRKNSTGIGNSTEYCI